MQPTMMNLKVQCFKYVEKHMTENGTPDEAEMFGIVEQFLIDTFDVRSISQIIAANWNEICHMENDMMFGFWVSGNRIGIGRECDKERGLFGLIEILLADYLGNWVNETVEGFIDGDETHLVLDEDPEGSVPSIEMWHWTEIADRAAKLFIDLGKHLILYDPDTPHQVWKKDVFPIAFNEIAEDYTMEESVINVLNGWNDFRNTQSFAGAFDGEFVDRIPHMVHRLIHLQADYQDIGEERTNGLSAMVELALSKSLVIETRNRVYELLSESYGIGHTYTTMIKNDVGEWDEQDVVGKYAYNTKEK